MNTVNNPLEIWWSYYQYKVNKPEIDSCVVVDLEIAKQLLEALEALYMEVGMRFVFDPSRIEEGFELMGEELKIPMEKALNAIKAAKGEIP